eukprot:TRINITY_DN7960_c0_g2_i1.p1 TRINITY_DN7960_c0_g2~~TRINITY_DN7960_c0_g2_i1.p1  ORF type:complete len:213 (+),score=33.72 TRINITY_DN7960_c0_g2_i1:301-939(+)
MHNGLYDLMFMYHQFQESLPGSFEAFAGEIHGLFPEVYDTKHLANYCKFPKAVMDSTALEPLFAFVKGWDNEFATRVTLADGFNRYRESKSYLHEAGYDAYLCGYIFTSIKAKGLLQERDFRNYVNLMTSLHHCHLAGLSVPFALGTCFHLRAIPSSFNTQDLARLLVKYPGYKLIWVSDTSCIVTYDKDTKHEENEILTLLAPYSTSLLKQ